MPAPLSPLPSWLRLEGDDRVLRIFSEPRLAFHQRLSLASGVVWFAVMGIWGAFSVGGVELGGPALLLVALTAARLHRGASRGLPPAGHPRVMVTSKWIEGGSLRPLEAQRISAEDIQSIECISCPPTSYGSDSTYSVILRFGGRPTWSSSATRTLVSNIPSSAAAEQVTARIRGVLGLTPMGRSNHPAPPLRTNLVSTAAEVSVTWGRLGDRMTATDEALFLRRRFRRALRIDADELEDLAVEPNPNSRRLRLMATLTRGRRVELIGTHDPADLAEHLLPHLRRVLRLDR